MEMLWEFASFLQIVPAEANKHSEKAPFRTECFDFPMRTNILTLATILNAS